MVYLSAIANNKPSNLRPKHLQRPSMQLDLPLVWPPSRAGTPTASARSSPCSSISLSPKAMPENLEGMRQKVLQASFFLADKDRDNQLSKAEFSLMVRRAYPHFKQIAIERAFLLARLGTGTSVNFKAFVEWVRKDHKEEGEDTEDSEPLWAVFRLWDLDEDEAISPAELEYGIKKAFPKTGKEELLRLLSAMMGDRENIGLAAPLPTLRNGNAPSSGRDRRETLQDQGKSGVTYLDFVNFVFPPGKADLAAQVSARVMGG